MKKKEFLSELRSRLKGLPKEEIDQRIEFYSEMIDDSIEDGLTEEKAVANVGDMDEVVRTIAADTSLLKIVKNKAKTRRRSPALIVFLILGFPLWFPLALVLVILCLVFCLLLWILPIVTFAVFAGVLGGGGGAVIVGLTNLFSGNVGHGVMLIGMGLMALGLSVFIFLLAMLTVKITLKLNKLVFTGIKVSFLGRGE